MLNKRTKLEKVLIVVVVIMAMAIISGFIMFAGYLVMDPDEKIKVVCPTTPPYLEGPFQGAYGEETFLYWELYCDQYFHGLDK